MGYTSIVGPSPISKHSTFKLTSSLDTIDIAGLSHDFGSLKKQRSVVASAFEEMSNTKPSPIFDYLFVFAHLFPQ